MNEISVDYQNKEITSGSYSLKYEISDKSLIIVASDNIDELVKMAFLIGYFNKVQTIINKTDKKLHLFNDQKEIAIDDYYIKRVIAIGDLDTGMLNSITDVSDVLVGQMDVKDGRFNTGITVVLPHLDNTFTNKVVASSYVFNGFGKSVGLVQVDELGSIETPIALTSTLNVGKVLDAMQSYMLEINPSVTSINPVVLECNDGSLNDSRERIIGKSHLLKALENSSKYLMQGDFGAGSGMMCHGFKGGIGTASRKIMINEKEYTIGLLINANFGSANGEELIIKGRRMKPFIKPYLESYLDKGSIVGVMATDLTINERQIKRILKRIELGIARTGSYAGNGSGDLFVGFSTKNMITKPFNKEEERISDNDLNIAFKAIVECAEEATINAMLYAHHVVGFKKEAEGLLQYLPSFSDLLTIEIIQK